MIQKEDSTGPNSNDFDLLLNSHYVSNPKSTNLIDWTTLNLNPKCMLKKLSVCESNILDNSCTSLSSFSTTDTIKLKKDGET